MAGNYSYNYDRLSPVQESSNLESTQDITDLAGNSFNPQWTLQQLSPTAPSPPAYNSIDRTDLGDRSSVKSFNTYGTSSSSSSTSIDKLKSGWNRIRKKPLPRYLQGSIRRHPAADIHPNRIGRGVWKDQFLVDRSLRSMALLTTVFAIAMIIVVATNLGSFLDRKNKSTSSVGGKPRDCATVTHQNTALLLLINIAATMVLGMSNTYQQLVTSLCIGDLKHMLEKFGDSRVGTNSPFNINHKQNGKLKSWLAWLLLITTSLPVHFLANSLIGPSYIVEPPAIVEYDEMTYYQLKNNSYYSQPGVISDYASFVCWSAFRTGEAHFPKSTNVLSQDDSILGVNADKSDMQYNRIKVHYASENCTELANSTTDVGLLESSYTLYYYSINFIEGNCRMGSTVICSLSEAKPAQCRLNVRMNAAFILAACLVAKAIYMVTVNLMARGKLKRQLLTFGDVIVASASTPELRVQGECLVNAGDNYRRSSSHTCHKHCKSKEESKTGDEIGHCQKCKKWNSVNKLSNQPQPTLATKIKKSLIANLGNTALTQMLLLFFCGFCMLGASLFVAVTVGLGYTGMTNECKDPESSFSSSIYCKMSGAKRFATISGGWGGFNQSVTVASLPADQMANEVISFCISNGAQFIYSLLYLMLLYNVSLISQEYDWGKLEWRRNRLRCTIVKGDCFSQDYLLQLQKRLLFPIMGYSILTHWMLGEALQTQESIWREESRGVEHSKYTITYSAYPLWTATLLILIMTGICWWAYTYTREGFIPQMFGSVRVLCSATTQLDDFPSNGIKWGDLGMGKMFRHAGLSSEEVMPIVPHELYAGLDSTAPQDDQFYFMERTKDPSLGT